MTIQDLYDWASQHNALELDIEVQYRDGGGCYSGTDDDIEPVIENKVYGKIVIL